MFQSYTAKGLGYDEEKKEPRYEITIRDDDFTETMTVSIRLARVVAVTASIIEIYSRRNLNVAKNLWLLNEHCNQRWGSQGQRLRFEWWQQHVPEYAPHHDEVLFYLTFT